MQHFLRADFSYWDRVPRISYWIAPGLDQIHDSPFFRSLVYRDKRRARSTLTSNLLLSPLVILLTHTIHNHLAGWSYPSWATTWARPASDITLDVSIMLAICLTLVASSVTRGIMRSVKTLIAPSQRHKPSEDVPVTIYGNDLALDAIRSPHNPIDVLLSLASCRFRRSSLLVRLTVTAFASLSLSVSMCRAEIMGWGQAALFAAGSVGMMFLINQFLFAVSIGDALKEARKEVMARGNAEMIRAIVSIRTLSFEGIKSQVMSAIKRRRDTTELGECSYPADSLPLLVIGVPAMTGVLGVLAAFFRASSLSTLGFIMWLTLSLLWLSVFCGAAGLRGESQWVTYREHANVTRIRLYEIYAQRISRP